MLLKAGVLSLGLLLASRLLGLLRESVQAAAFGASGLADVAVLMLTLPDWFTGVAISGALAYVLVPAWAGRSAAQVDGLQRQVARVLLVAGVVAALAMLAGREPLARLLAAGLQGPQAAAAAEGLAWSAVALPLALLAALWGTRLQHERDFTGLYAANLVVNGVLIAAIVIAGTAWASTQAILVLGLGLLAAMVLRLAWQAWRRPRGQGATPVAAVPSVAVPQAPSQAPSQAQTALAVPGAGLWAWAILSAGLPLALPFMARSLASAQGQGALATFSYAWKLVELPLVLAIQLVATLAFPAVAQAVTRGLQDATARQPVRIAFALAFALACACAAGLLVGAGALAQLLFGWGRMPPEALARVADWGRVAAWGLLPQAVSAVALTVLASQGRMRPAAGLYALALLGLGAATLGAPLDGQGWMGVLNGVFTGVAIGLLIALGPQVRHCLPWRALAWPAVALALVAVAASWGGDDGARAWPLQMALAVAAGLFVLAAAWAGAGSMRHALRR